MDKLILIYVFVALLQAVTSETEDSLVLPKDLLHVEDHDSPRRQQADPEYLLPTLSTDIEPSKLRNNSDMKDISELQTVTNDRGSSETTAATKSISNNEGKSESSKRPSFSTGAFPTEGEHESDVNNSATSDTKISNLETSQLKKQFQPLENTSADDESRGTARKSGNLNKQFF